MRARWHVGILGLGTVGTALARTLHARTRSSPTAMTPPARISQPSDEPRDVRLVAIASRRTGVADALAAQLPGAIAVSPEALAAHADVVLLAVADRDLADVARWPFWLPGQVLAHLSGATGAAALADALPGRAAQHCGSLHPMVSLPRGATVPITHFDGAVAAVDGDTVAREALGTIARVLGLAPVHVPHADRARWHAAATLVGNAPAALVRLADAMLEPLDLEPTMRRQALIGLLQSVVRNLAAHPPASSLADTISGPVARGDTDTLARHRAALVDTPWLGEAYDAACTLTRLALAGPPPSPSTPA
jgi:predicted short-subunit dehydrogenase-like oxidoreductase (DUF2520 family)